MHDIDARRIHNENNARRLVGPFDLDTLTRENAAFPSFAAMIEAADRGYVPTLRPDLGIAFAILADAYDCHQASRGRPERACR